MHLAFMFAKVAIVLHAITMMNESFKNDKPRLLQNPQEE